MPAELRSILRAVIWVLFLTAILPTKADPDLWGNLRFGQDLLASRTLSTVDPYSFTQDKPWINHDWLPQVAMAVAYAAAGAAGLVVLKALLAAAALWLVAGAFARSAYLVAEAAVALVLFAALPLIASLRPQLWSFVALAVLCRLILSSRPRAMAWAPVLFAVWVNCHVGWIVGLAVLAWWTIGVLARGPAPARRRAAWIAAASVGATLLNPYGWHMWEFSAGVAHLSRDITEWQPLWRGPWLNLAAFAAGAGLVAVGYLRLRPRMPLERLVPIAGLGYAAVRAIKFVDLFVITATMFLAPAIVARFPAIGSRGAPVAAGMRVLNGAVIAGLVAFTVIRAWPGLTCLTADDWRPDPVAARALLNASPAGRIVVTFDWGEYVIWHLGPRLRVSYDPRYDLVYSAATIAEQAAVRDLGPAGVAFLERSRPEYVWFRQSDARLKAWLMANGYRIDIDSAESFVAVRADVGPLLDPGPQVSGCFPA